MFDVFEVFISDVIHKENVLMLGVEHIVGNHNKGSGTFFFGNKINALVNGSRVLLCEDKLTFSSENGEFLITFGHADIKAFRKGKNFFKFHSGSGAANCGSGNGVEHKIGRIEAELNAFSVNSKGRFRKIHIGSDEIRFRRFKTAVFTMEGTHMIIMIIIIGKSMQTFRADFCVVGAASAFFGGTFVFSESKPDNGIFSAPANLLGNRVVCVKNKSGSGGDSHFYLIENDFRAAVTDDLVAEKVCDKKIIRFYFLNKETEPAFIYFENGIIRFYPSFKSAVGEKRSGDSAKHVGTEAIVDYGKTVFSKNMGDHIGSGGFSVCSGDADYFSVEFKAF
jgi:hypothetical protein